MHMCHQLNGNFFFRGGQALAEINKKLEGKMVHMLFFKRPLRCIIIAFPYKIYV